jgi:hypothetical protein
LVNAPNSLEVRVDDLWQCILTQLFPTTQGYFVHCRAPLDGTHLTADVLLRRPGNGGKIYFTMSNKRKSHDQPFFWTQAEAQLKSYLEKEYEIGTAGDRSMQHGAVAIGTKVRLYGLYHSRRGKVEWVCGGEYNVEHGRDKLQKALMEMKTQIEVF